jgi:hypothetical protein
MDYFLFKRHYAARNTHCASTHRWDVLFYTERLFHRFGIPYRLGITARPPLFALSAILLLNG